MVITFVDHFPIVLVLLSVLLLYIRYILELLYYNITVTIQCDWIEVEKNSEQHEIVVQFSMMMMMKWRARMRCDQIGIDWFFVFLYRPFIDSNEPHVVWGKEQQHQQKKNRLIEMYISPIHFSKERRLDRLIQTFFFFIFIVIWWRKCFTLFFLSSLGVVIVVKWIRFEWKKKTVK